MTRLVIITGIENSGQRRRRSREYATAAAVVEAACEEGKLQSLGVATWTRMRGSLGRCRRTTRFATTLTAWAPTTVAVARSQGRRCSGSRAAPSSPNAVQARACSPTWLRITAPRRIPDDAVSDWILTRAATSCFRRLAGLINEEGRQRSPATTAGGSGRGWGARPW